MNKKGVTSEGYKHWLEIMKGLKDLNIIRNLSYTLTTLKKQTLQQTPLLSQQYTEIPLIAAKLPTLSLLEKKKQASIAATAKCIFYNTMLLFKCILSTKAIREAMYFGMA